MIDKEYSEALEQAKENLKDLEERGEEAIGDDWEDVRQGLFTAEEIAQSNFRVTVISELIKARQAQEINQTQFEEYARVLETMQNLLAVSGKQLAVVSV